MALEKGEKGLLDLLFSAEGLFLLVIFAFRLGFLREVHLELSPDEAYYWDWSRHLAFGYYSKPPLVAWLIAASTHLLGISEYAVRLPALLCGMGFLVFFYLLVYRLFGRLPARWALFAAALTPIFTVFGLLMTIDPPLLFFWAGALYFGWQAAEENSLRYWFLLGLFCGLGLLTKQTMLAFGAFYGLWLFFYRRELLRRPGPWITLAVALLLWAPNLHWMATHNWITLRHTEHHFKEEEGTYLLGPGRFLAEQAGVFSPLLFGLFAWGAFMLFRRRDWRERPELSYLWVLSAWPYLAVLPLSFLRKVNANWPMPFFVAGLALASGIVFSLKGGRKARLLRGIYLAGLLLALLGTALLYQLPRFPEKFPRPVAGLLFRFYGWRKMARTVERYRRPGEPLVANHRYLASELAFYLPDHPQVYQLPAPRPKSQYHLWGIPQGLCGRKILWALKEGGPPPSPEAIPLFRGSFPLPGGRKRTLSLWRGYFIINTCFSEEFSL
ncbi:glycosyltransferase family 39 protein [Thermosulfurimonas marina]|uniref:Glycosyltransferase family 39 protein n=1 Tax=Thermosulfurimonas marina TaxID=2047767 RepID=A0A6H1WQI8_9BACT|nr:glycosyltransferase family 39 protein [Thermosulfurimonas marina]QJA05485.1 glycosyltransferase family 39 protein [Thermosulfurimonas marina]